MTSIERVASEVAEQFAPVLKLGDTSHCLNGEHCNAYVRVLDVLKRAESAGFAVFRDTSADFLMRRRPRSRHRRTMHR